MNSFYETAPFMRPSQSFLLLHSNPSDAQPLAVASVQHAHELKVFGGLDANTDEFCFLMRYLYDYMGPMIVCGVDNLELALDRFGNTINEFIIPISQLTSDQFIQCVDVLERLRTGCLYMCHQQEVLPAPQVEYRTMEL